MMHEFVTYPDGTLVVSSDIRRKENGEEYITVCFERPTPNGSHTIIFELPSYDILKNEGNYTDNDIAMFKTVAKRGAAYFFEIARKASHANYVWLTFLFTFSSIPLCYLI